MPTNILKCILNTLLVCIFMVNKTMINHLKNKIVIILCFLALIILMLNFSIFNFAAPYNFEYVNVTSKVNVTNAYPMITSVRIDSNITLNAGSTKSIKCNVSITDWNGYADIKNVSATFWDNTSANSSSPDGIDHYTNSSCTNITGQLSSYYANYTCSFNVWYYANNGSNWMCNVTVQDNYNFNDSRYNITDIRPLWAINVTPTIDFGEMAVGETRNNITANITNFGNMPVNISVNGYGNTTNDGLAMKCAIRNISISNLRFSINASQIWDDKANLSNSLKNISGLTIPKSNGTFTQNVTYWDLYIPPSENPFGLCTGTVVFTAVAT